MSKQKTSKRAAHQATGTSTDKQLRELDVELSRRLDATLGAHAKFELEAMRALARLAPLEEESSSSREGAVRPEERQDSVQSPAGGVKTAPSTTETDRPSAEILAKVVFKDGDAFHFLGVPTDGEIGVAYIGKGGALAGSHLRAPITPAPVRVVSASRHAAALAAGRDR